MNRQKRKQDLRLRPFLDKLETRRLMSVSAADERTGHPLARAAAELESEIGGGDLGGFAQELAQRPRLAADLGLGALSRVLRRHAGYAERHGWAASLESELRAHPNYAATHHLTAALGDPKTPAVATVTPPARTIATKTEPASQTIARKTTPVLQNVAVVTSDLTALQQLENTFAKAAASQPASPTIVAPTPTAPTSPAAPSVVLNDPLSVGIGGALDVTLPNLGLGTSGLTFTITPQPLPANATFNRQTGVLIFTPAPGQQGSYDFSVAVSNGSQNGLITVPVTVTAPALASTELSGRVVDENGNPLSDMPVTVDGVSTVTDSSGNFTLTGVSTNPGPISAGGSVGTEQGRLDLTAPVAQLLGHDLYTNADNVIPSPLILPTINWSTAASFSRAPSATSVNITTPAAPGLSIQMPVSATAVLAASGSVQVAELPAALSAQHMAPGMSGPLLLYNIVGTGLSSSAQVTLPNTSGFKPGAVVYLTQFNPVTGGHDVVGQLVVSDDGETMTSTSPIALSATGSTVAGASPAFVALDDGPTILGYTGCWGIAMQPSTPTPVSTCDGCQSTAGGSSPPPNTTPRLSAMTASAAGGTSGVMDSDAGLVTGEYFLNNQLSTYQAQGRAGCDAFCPLFFRLAVKCTKVFTPHAPDFCRIFRYFASSRRKNRDFYPSTPLCGGSIAM